MKIYALDHVQVDIPPGEEQRGRAFYSGVLGLVEIPKPPELAHRGGVWFEGGAAKLHLGIRPDFRPSTNGHPALLVDGLDELLERCRQAGCKLDISQPPLEGYRRAHVLDFFGNRIELMEKITHAGEKPTTEDGS